MSELFVGHAPGKRIVCTGSAGAVPTYAGAGAAATSVAAVGTLCVELLDSLRPSNLLKLGAKTRNLCGKFDADLGVGWFVFG
jgi:hypothetical protein